MTDPFDEENITVETPWGRMITATGFRKVFEAFDEDLGRFHQFVEGISDRLDLIERSLASETQSAHVNEIGRSVKDLKEELKDQKEKFQHFQDTVKRTFSLVLGELKRELDEEMDESLQIRDST